MTRTFQLHRDHDVSGLSGTGVVADGATFPDGVTVIRWRGERQSTVVWPSVDDVVAIHGHGGATRLVWDDPAPAPSVVPDAAVEAFKAAWHKADDEGREGERVRDGLAAALPLLTAEPLPEATDWKALARENVAVLRGDADATERMRHRVEGHFADEAAQPAPNATREEVSLAIRSVTDRWDEPLDEVRDVPPVADALLARFAIAPKEDR